MGVASKTGMDQSRVVPTQALIGHSRKLLRLHWVAHQLSEPAQDGKHTQQQSQETTPV